MNEKELEETSLVLSAHQQDDNAMSTSITTKIPTRTRNKKKFNQTRTAAILTSATLVLLAIVSITTHVLHLNTDHPSNSNQNNRDLEDNDDGNNDNDNDYSQYTCDDIFLYTEANTDERCLFAQTCNSSQGLSLSFVFCNTWNLSLTAWCSILSPFLTMWLVLLFRMLGSTAEDFFSPSLEMFSIKMGLPPRFAGVTLLALGNGAADVSATISAIAQNPQEGYLMAMGALTGAGMFVGTVVAGIVIVVADGVKCRGALVRDLLMFIITLVVVYVYFDKGEIGPSAIHCFFWLYFSFVVVVLAADIYHRAVVLPRIRKEEEYSRSQIQGAEGADGDGANAENIEDGRNGMEHVVNFNLSNVMQDDTAASPSSPRNGIELAGANTSSTLFHTPLNSQMEESDVSNYDGQTSPLHHGVSPPKKRGRIRRGVDRIMVAMSNYGPDEGKSVPNKSFYNGWSGGLEVNSERNDEHVKLHGATGILTRQSSVREEPEENVRQDQVEESATSYRVLMEGVDNMCTIEGSLSSGMGTPWGQTWANFKQELNEHFYDYQKDIWENEENNAFDKFFLTFEMPFTVLRKLTIPIPCDDYYCRALIAASVALTPIWIGIYAMIQHHSNLFWFGGFPYIEVFTFFSVIIGFFMIKFAPAEETDMSLNISVPIAFLGFIIAATWIDTIADQLVQLLTFLGVICRIPGSIMGLTVLAWGNSMGDLSANMTMAKKGLANMAITACFAGPVFNILIGLGGGFATLNSITGDLVTEVQLTPSINVGLGFLAANCLLVVVSGLIVNRGKIPKGYGYVALALYVIYLIASVGLQLYQPN